LVKTEIMSLMRKKWDFQNTRGVKKEGTKLVQYGGCVDYSREREARETREFYDGMEELDFARQRRSVPKSFNDSCCVL